MKRVEFCDVELALNERHREGPLAPGHQLEDRLRKAVLTYNTCINVCKAFWPYLHKVFRAMPGFISLEANYQRVRPRLILFPSTETPGEETTYWHHYIVIKFRDKISFVLDFAGYQFGFSKVIYTLKECEHEVLDMSETPVVIDTRKYIDAIEADAKSEERDVWQRKAFEWCDIIWESS